VKYSKSSNMKDDSWLQDLFVIMSIMIQKVKLQNSSMNTDTD
jgi:hypothetical protein